MEIRRPIAVPTELQALVRQQTELARLVELTPGSCDPKRVAGADVAYSRDQRRAYAAVVVMEPASGRTVDHATWIGEPPAAYWPGLFSLREAACLLEAFSRLDTAPDVILVDGHGTAHPRRFGLACHIGLTLETSSVGCAKSRLCGEFRPLPGARGSRVPLTEGQRIIGTVLRTRPNVRPVFVSPGHRFDFDTAAELVLSLAPTYRIPEPLRRAHQLSVALRAGRA